MSLSAKVVLSFVITILVAVTVSAVFNALNTKELIENNIQEKSLVLVKAYESQIGSGSGKEDSSGFNAAFNGSIEALIKSIPSIHEITIHKISTGKTVASSERDKVGKDVDPEDVLAAKEDRTVTLFAQEDGHTIIDVTSPLHHDGKIDYVIGIKSEVDKDYQRIGTDILKSFGIELVLIVLVGGIAYGMARYLVKPVKTASDALKAIAEGHGDLTMRFQIHRSDVIGKMAQDFNIFLDKLNSIVAVIKESQVQLNSVATELHRGAQDTAASVGQIAKTVLAAQDKANSQASVIFDSVSAIEEIAKNIESLGRMVSSQSSSVTEASASVEQITANIASVFQAMEQMAQQFESVLKSIGEGKAAQEEAARLAKLIAERSRSLQNANAIIASIASSTNLLAMNAAIEAAHAGEAGRGFSVVADEIRKLAENAAKQSGQIRQDIKEVHGNIDSIVANTERLGQAFGQVELDIEATGRLVAEVRTSMSEQREGSNQLLGLIGNLKSITQEVRLGSEEMETGNASLLSGTTRMKAAAEGMKSDMDDISTAVESLEASVQSVADSAENASHSVDAMEKAVENFKI